MVCAKSVNNIERILTDKRLSSFKSMLGKKHAIDCILLLYLEKGHYKDAMLFMQNLELPFSDGAYYARMKELIDLGLAKSVPIDSYRKYNVKTVLGEKIAKLLLEFFKEISW